MKLKDVDDEEFLKSGWEGMEGEFVQGYVESKEGGWTADQVGFWLVFALVLRAWFGVVGGF